jgi:hypothetical protein
VERVLVEAWASMQEEDKRNKFHVVVVDSRPLLEGTFNEAQTVLGADPSHRKTTALGSHIARHPDNIYPSLLAPLYSSAHVPRPARDRRPTVRRGTLLTRGNSRTCDAGKGKQDPGGGVLRDVQVWGQDCVGCRYRERAW